MGKLQYIYIMNGHVEYVRGTSKVIANGVTVSELARRVNLGVSTISRYFSGERIPNFWVALQLAHALDVDPWQLAYLIDTFKRYVS